MMEEDERDNEGNMCERPETERKGSMKKDCCNKSNKSDHEWGN